MRKVVQILTVILSLVFVSSAYTESVDSFSYGDGIKFGMTMNEVMMNLPAGADITFYANRAFSHPTKAAGKQAIVIYEFTKKATLGSITLKFTDSHNDPQDYYNDFVNLDAAYELKYGEPDLSEDMQWNKNTYKNKPNSYGKAIYSGHLFIQSKWDKTGYEIWHAIGAYENEVQHAVKYEMNGFSTSVSTDGI